MCKASKKVAGAERQRVWAGRLPTLKLSAPAAPEVAAHAPGGDGRRAHQRPFRRYVPEETRFWSTAAQQSGI